jgi:hypothetical protein
MVFPALAVLLDRPTLEALGGNWSNEQRGHGNGGEGDGEVTHGVFSLALCRWRSLFETFHIICLCEIYIYRNLIKVDVQGNRSLFVNATRTAADN